MKERKYRLPDASLPEAATKWLDEYFLRTQQRGLANPKLAPLYERLELLSTKIGLNNSNYSIRTFRDAHGREIATSITRLHIDDDLCLRLLWENVYTVDILEQKLHSGEICAATFRGKSITSSCEEIEKIKNAIRLFKTEYIRRRAQ